MRLATRSGWCRNASRQNSKCTFSDSRRCSPIGPMSAPLHRSRSVDLSSKLFKLFAGPLPSPLRNFHEVFRISGMDHRPQHSTIWLAKSTQMTANGYCFILSSCLIHIMTGARVGSLRKCRRNISFLFWRTGPGLGPSGPNRPPTLAR